MTLRTLPTLVPDHSYTVETHCSCKVVRGSVPLHEMSALTAAWADLSSPGTRDEWRLDLELAGWLEVTMVAGSRANLERLRERVGCRPTTEGA